MFRKLSSFRKRSSDDSHRPRAQQIPSVSYSRNSSQSDDSVPTQDVDANSIISAGRSSQGTTSTKSPQKDGGPDAGPLGLNVVYSPENGHKVDIVFIHGLGGTSQLTWSKYKKPELFWPLTFLPLEPDLCLARILSFGYNANFRKSGNISTSVLDFAKDLLFDLKYAKDEDKNDLNMGNAYMQGQNDPEYEPIIKAISAITFLATPHRGTNLAEKLNRILQSTLITNSKQYISDLAKNSFTLQKLNEQFRHVAPRLDIVSFYETQPTAMGLKNARLMVLEKDSSVLGYPGETSKALDADHHGVCKYDSPRDPNYITVRNVLKSLVSKMISTSKSGKMPVPNRKDSHDLKALLSITEVPNTDYIFFMDQWTEGTNEWIFEEKAYLDWVGTQDQTARVLWLNGGAAIEPRTIWERIFKSILFEMKLQEPLYWVIDAIDEADDPRMVMRQADVELALEQLPVGMQALYDRMAALINQNPSPTDKEFASAVLQCVTCSFRLLTVAELSEALNEDTSEMLDLQRSIVDLCGGFVVVDNGGNIAMVHQTAREYLLGGVDRPFQINRKLSHERMLSSCLHCLMTPALRAKISRGQTPAFLEYASTSWSLHLTLISPDSEQTLEALRRFLTGQWVLTWIQVLAASNNLRILIQASKHLSKFASKRWEYDAIQTTWNPLVTEQELLESWAVDFVKIIGKFGKVLQRNPDYAFNG
ncbi:hypothetical protein SLS62_001398 [Diatrype stigma]|uniref:DUF676 domain-containing protein n=1 Tax=Diatrype stigma TaxID=117547 RepID=A0AAN9YTH9_9PEZI